VHLAHQPPEITLYLVSATVYLGGDPEALEVLIHRVLVLGNLDVCRRAREVTLLLLVDILTVAVVVAVLPVFSFVLVLSIADAGRAERYHERKQHRDNERHDPQEHRRCAKPAYHYIPPVG
jgi:hypothetical protein